MIKILGDKNSLLHTFIAEIRDETTQKDSMRFRRNLERVGEIFAYEISKTLNYQLEEVKTPLGIAEVPKLKDQVVLSTILRAGLPVHNGMLNYFDQAENAFISAYRVYEKDGTFNIRFQHISGPSIENKIVILCDPMLATGASAVLSAEALKRKGTPAHLHIVSIIASKEGIENVQQKLPKTKTTLWVGAVDDELTSKAYIVPGLGDAGDLAYGSKSDD